MYRYVHPKLGPLFGRQVHDELVQFRSVPYAIVPRRFARAQLLEGLPSKTQSSALCYDASEFGPSSIQPFDSIATDIRWNQLPAYPHRPQAQDEDCLRITLTVPKTALETPNSDAIPIVAFIHGGALLVGSGERQFYDPVQFCADAIKGPKSLIFASINYRLGALGFLHCPEASDILPPNNGLYDQLRAFEWINAFVPGFGGDAANITLIGQSAGAASLSLHNSNLQSEALYRRAIVLSGSSTVLVTMSPEEHQKEFLHQAEKLNIPTEDRTMEMVAKEVANAPLDAIRNLNYAGVPCSNTELIQDKDWATMHHAQQTRPNVWLESQVIACCTYDGSISYMVEAAQDRRHKARTFSAICKARINYAHALLDLYGICETDADDVALEKICQVVTDVGFHAAAVSTLIGAADSVTKSIFLIYDIPNPFRGTLPQGHFATHTWDIVSLLGAYDDQLPGHYREAISEWRNSVISYCYSGIIGCKPWHVRHKSALRVSMDGVRALSGERLAKSRAEQLVKLAREDGGDQGFDKLWEDVVRFYLKTGNPRYAHELDTVIGEEDIPPH